MSMPCANCGEPLPDDAHRCPACDALAPLPTDRPADGDGGLPWAIPIRDGPEPEPRSPVPDRRLVYGLVAVALLAGLAVLASLVLGGEGDDSLTAPDSEVDGAGPAGSDDSDGAAGDDEREEERDGEREPDDDTTSSTTTSAPTTSTTTSVTAGQPTTAPTTTVTTNTAAAGPAPTSVTAPPGPGSAPLLSPSFPGGWIAQLTSVPASAGTAAVEAAWRQTRTYAPGAVVTASGGWASLQPGFWVVLAPGPFASPDEARAYCAAIEHPAGEDCLPRQLSGRR